MRRTPETLSVSETWPGALAQQCYKAGPLGAFRRLPQCLLSTNAIGKNYVELFFELEAGPVQSAANGSHRELKDLRDFVVIAIVNFSEH